MRNIRTLLFVICLLAFSIKAALHVELAGGYSLQSQYQYFAGNPALDTFPWITYNPINNVCASTRLSVDLWKSQFRFGVYAGFMRRYTLVEHRKNGSGNSEETLGDILSLPILGFIEGRYNAVYYEFGLGPYITRFNYSKPLLPKYSVTSLFGFLFGAGYDYPLTTSLGIIAKGELLVNAPVFFVNYLDTALKKDIQKSRYTEYNSNEFQTIIYNGTISIGLRYDFGETIRIPLEDGIKKDGVLHF